MSLTESEIVEQALDSFHLAKKHNLKLGGYGGRFIHVCENDIETIYSGTTAEAVLAFLKGYDTAMEKIGCQKSST